MNADAVLARATQTEDPGPGGPELVGHACLEHRDAVTERGWVAAGGVIRHGD
jgi:hypothetical protein